MYEIKIYINTNNSDKYKYYILPVAMYFTSHTLYYCQLHGTLYHTFWSKRNQYVSDMQLFYIWFKQGKTTEDGSPRLSIHKSIHMYTCQYKLLCILLITPLSNFLFLLRTCRKDMVHVTTLAKGSLTYVHIYT